MLIKTLKLKNYRNYKLADIELGENINIFYGDNAQGKTNILESIYISSIGRSFRTNSDDDLITFNEEESQIKINFLKDSRDQQIGIILKRKKRKEIKLNKIKIEKMADMVGIIKTVIFSPDDMDILKGSPGKRRRFLDILISQISRKYIYNLNKFNKILEQRNALLKQMNLKTSSDMLDVWDNELIVLEIEIAKIRQEIIQSLNDKAKLIHSKLTNSKEKIEIKYLSDIINKDINIIKDEYIKKREIDIQRGYTQLGIHRDEIEIKVNNQLVSVYGSQGQNRTALLTLKLSQLSLIEEKTNQKPILLLDDVMSELDQNRVNNLIDNLLDLQVIITTTNIDNLVYLKEKEKNINIYKVSKGKIKKVN